MHPAWSKCLVGFVALLSPIHALQGTHLSCPYGSPYHVVRQYLGTDDLAGSHCCGRAGRSFCRKSGPCDANPVTQEMAHPAAPCSCPTTCICYSLRQPQLPSSKPVHVDRPVDFVCVSEILDDSSAGAGAVFFQSREFAPDHIPSAQQKCAHLCRFLA